MIFTCRIGGISMSILIIQPEDLAPAGEITTALKMAGEHYTVFRMEENTILPKEINKYEALIILGGSMGAYDDSDFPFLTEIKSAILNFYRSNKPILGICLGAQLICSAYKKAVRKMEKPEFGMMKLRKTEEGKSDPLFRNLPDTFSFMEWHEDYFELPEKAVRLATGSNCKNQAFRIGDYIYGFQFHPEVNKTILESWVKEKKNWILQQDSNFMEKMDGLVKVELSSSKRYCHQIIYEWLKLVQERRAYGSSKPL